MISKKTQYGLKALGYLAAQYGKGPVLIADIAEKKKIPIKFLESILLLLKQNNVLESKKGKGGGYFLANAPKKTNLAAVIRIIGGPIAMLPCVSLNFYTKCEDCDEVNCGLRRVMAITRDATLKVLEKKTLHDLIDGCVEMEIGVI
ncbi:Rrf2 family transcriptional regulator [Ferruginibacter sp. HRS2-29]|uniref:RrF2 family transcriptional regulator n=1 Tax=Ferruginibacter sp. HRS2-29 TaxID=2487334 RepID=UPI0020CBA246|nr:Rrf2 family transcriptional regulator [Ferruginibacter sp. HRS2-29]MCP9751270.1 Rrf2 family transcriptional regulator [Ferruginibacter sp. HRS2-29]